MQGNYRDGFGEPVVYDHKKLEEFLEHGAESVSVFRKNSKEHDEAINNFKLHPSKTAKNRERRWRKKKKK